MKRTHATALLLLTRLLPLVASCGPERTGNASIVANPQPAVGISKVPTPPAADETVQPVFNLFLQYATSYMASDMPTIQFATQAELNNQFLDAAEGEEDLNVLGHCAPASNTIYITNPKVTGMNRIQFEMILLHEIGHCVLHRTHRFDTAWDMDTNSGVGLQVPLSLMFPVQILSLSYYTAHRDDYLRELVGNNTNGPLLNLNAADIIHIFPVDVNKINMGVK